MRDENTGIRIRIRICICLGIRSGVSENELLVVQYEWCEG